LDRRLAHDLAALAALAASGALFYLSSSPLLSGLGLLSFLVLAWLRLDLAVLAVLLFVPFFIHPKYITATTSFAPSELLLIAVAVVAVVVAGGSLAGVFPEPVEDGSNVSVFRSFPWPGTRPAWSAIRRSPFLLPALLFAFAAIVSTAFAVEHKEALRTLRETVIEPIVFFGLLLLFCGGDSGRAKLRTLLTIGLTLVATGLTPAVIGLAQLVTNSSYLVVVTSRYSAIRAWYGSRDNLGLLFDRTLPMALALLFAPSAVWQRVARDDGVTSTSNGEIALRVAMTVVVGIMGIAFLFTFSLGAWVATLVAGLVILTIRFSWGKWLAIALLVLVAIGALGSGKVGSAFTHVHGTTASRRIDIWRSSLRMIRDHPIVGIGPDNFLHYYAPRHQRGLSCKPGLGYMEPRDQTWREPCLSHPHNFVLDFWLSTGLLGLISSIWLEFVFWRILWRWRSSLRTSAPVLLGAGGAMLAGIAHGLVDNSYFLIDLSMITWFLFAIASLHDSMCAESLAS
jgi:O-antigen ligase